MSHRRISNGASGVLQLREFLKRREKNIEFLARLEQVNISTTRRKDRFRFFKIKATSNVHPKSMPFSRFIQKFQRICMDVFTQHIFTPDVLWLSDLKSGSMCVLSIAWRPLSLVHLDRAPTMASAHGTNSQTEKGAAKMKSMFQKKTEGRGCWLMRKKTHFRFRPGKRSVP